MMDSSKAIPKKIYTIEDKEKVDLLNSHAFQINIGNPKKALVLAKEAHLLAVQLNYSFGIGQSLLMMSYANRSLSNYYECMITALEAMDIFQALENKEGEMRALNLLGINYFYFSKYDQALEYFQKSCALAKAMNHEDLQASIFNNIGEIYRELEKYQDALEFYFMAMEISEKINKKYNVAVILMNIGHVYNKLSQNEKALAYYQRSLITSREIKDKISEGEGLNTIGEIYEKTGRIEDALTYYLNSLYLLQDCENKFYQIDVLINLGNFYIKTKKYIEGFAFLNKSLKLATEASANKKLYTIHLSLSRYYEEIEDFTKALFHYKKYHQFEKQVITDILEEKLKILTIELKVDKIQNEAEIYRLKNIELKQKHKDIEKKAEELERLSSLDALTGIQNRRSFNHSIKREWNRCLRQRVPLCVILIDIDFFKDFNDHYGHLQGDRCLKMVAKTLTSIVKGSSDFIARYGGEEFCVILPNTNYEGGVLVAEQMRKRIHALKIQHEYSSVEQYITVSAGVASVIPLKTLKFCDLIDAADKALYHAKNNGRNQVQFVAL